jgi:putative oxidoreductase
MQSHALAYAAPFGRLLLCLIFVMSAAGKVTDWGPPAQMIADKGLPAPDALLAIAVALELIGGVSVILGFQARWGAVALLLFLVPVSLIMHNFWTIEDPAQRVGQMINFMKNVSIAGGLLLVLAVGPGPCSVDNLLAAKRKPHEPLRPAGPV